MNCSISMLLVNRATSSQGLISGLPSMVRFISHRLNGRIIRPPRPGGSFRVHDHQPAAGAEQIPGVMQHREVMRDGVVGHAQHHAVERLLGNDFRGVLLEQIDVGPSVLRAKLARLVQHARRNIDAVNGSGRSDGGTQRRQIASGAASDLKDPTSRLQLEPFGGLLPELRRHEEKPIEQRNDCWGPGRTGG